MTGGEHEAQKVVADGIVDRRLERLHRPLPVGFELPAELVVLALEPLGSAEGVDRAMFRRCHQPGARIVRDPRLRPPLQRRDEGVLGKLLRQTEVANDPRQGRR